MSRLAIQRNESLIKRIPAFAIVLFVTACTLILSLVAFVPQATHAQSLEACTVVFLPGAENETFYRLLANDFDLKFSQRATINSQDVLQYSNAVATRDDTGLDISDTIIVDTQQLANFIAGDCIEPFDLMLSVPATHSPYSSGPGYICEHNPSCYAILYTIITIYTIDDRQPPVNTAPNPTPPDPDQNSPTGESTYQQEGSGRPNVSRSTQPTSVPVSSETSVTQRNRNLSAENQRARTVLTPQEDDYASTETSPTASDDVVTTIGGTDEGRGQSAPNDNAITPTSARIVTDSNNEAYGFDWVTASASVMASFAAAGLVLYFYFYQYLPRRKLLSAV